MEIQVAALGYTLSLLVLVVKSYLSINNLLLWFIQFFTHIRVSCLDSPCEYISYSVRGFFAKHGTLLVLVLMLGMVLLSTSIYEGSCIDE